jgi:DNA polymerase-3 subunit gamma/tau
VARLRQIAEGEGLRVESDALAFIARMSTGCARDAISLLDQLTAYSDETVTPERVRAVLGLSDEQSVYELIAALARHDIGYGLNVVGRVVESGVDVRQFAQQVIERLRTVLLLRVGGGGDTDDLDAPTRRAIEQMADRLTMHNLVRAIKLFNQAQLDLRGSDQSQLALELAFVEAALPHGSAQLGGVEQAEADRQGAFARAGSTLREDVSVRKPKEASTETTAPVTVGVSAAPPRVQPAPSGEDEPSQSALRPGDVGDVVPIALAEMEQNWLEIRQTIRSQSRQVEALVNSSTVLGMEQGNCLVLEFASEFLSSKLQKEENRRIVEQSIGEVLGKRCRVRATFRGSEGSGPVRQSSRITAETRADDEDRTEYPVADIYQEAEEDPVVQDLVSRGGQVTDVQVLSDE